MNKERIFELANVIENEVKHFNMEEFAQVKNKNNEWRRIDNETVDEIPERFEFCNTACCLAGAAVIKWGKLNINRICNCSDDAAEMLGLAQYQADQLFFPTGWEGERWRNIPKSLAAAVLRNLAVTGTVDWNIDYE